MLFWISPKISPILYSMVSRPAGLVLEAAQVGKQLLVDEVVQVVAGLRVVVVELSVPIFGRGPGFPAIGPLQHEGRTSCPKALPRPPVLLQPVEVFQEQQPRGLLGVVQLGGAASLLAKDIVDIPKGLFKHEGCPALYANARTPGAGVQRTFAGRPEWNLLENQSTEGAEISGA